MNNKNKNTIENGFKLSELLGLVEDLIHQNLQDSYWVVAEISNVNRHSSGHFYLDLVEKVDEELVAKTRGNIWKSKVKTVIDNFEEETNTLLKEGMEVLLKAEVRFHKRYGFSLTIHKIDPTYTLGEMARKKRETIEKLKKLNLYDLNKKLEVPLVVQNIAIISSFESQGYNDFIKTLQGNKYGYEYLWKLFPTLVQGDAAIATLIKALEKANKYSNLFDVIVIVRGGGSKVDLSCFDDFGVAQAIAKSKLPVLTGIGHERDETVADIVSNEKHTAPSKLAESIINRSREFDLSISHTVNKLSEAVYNTISRNEENLKDITRDTLSLIKERFEKEDKVINSIGRRLTSDVTDILHYNDKELNQLQYMLKVQSDQIISRQKDSITDKSMIISDSTKRLISNYKMRVKELGRVVTNMDPKNLLKKGYSITYLNGKPLKKAKDIKKGVTIETKLHNGTIGSIVKSVK